MFTTAVAFTLFSLHCVLTVFGSEPVCSRFHYEEQLLEKMIRQEIAVEKMKSEMEDMKRSVEATLNDIGVEKAEIAMDFEKKNVAFEQMERKMENAVTEIKARNGENKKAYSNELERVKASTVTPLVAFKAHKATDKTLSDNKVIVFTENLLNLGDAYNNKTGIFVAPVTGLYMFTAQICFKNNEWTYFGIFKQNRQVAGHPIGDKDWHGCSTFDSLTLVDQGNEVKVKCSSGCDTTESLWESGSIATNSFSGVLLRTLAL